MTACFTPAILQAAAGSVYVIDTLQQKGTEMPRTTMSKNNKYYMDSETYLAAAHYAKRYPRLKEELRHLPVLKGVAYDGEHVQSSRQSDTTFQLATRRAYLTQRIDAIESSCMQAEPVLYQWLLQGVCYKKSWEWLQTHGIPCGKNTYFNARQRALWLLSQKI